MLALTRKTDYGLVAMAYLANRPDQVCSAREIGEAHSIPLPVLMNILKALNRQGIISSMRGARGGYQLAIDVARVSLKEFIAAVEGPIRMVLCADEHHEGNASCVIAGCCPVQVPLVRLHDRFSDFLSQVPLSDIIQGPSPVTINTLQTVEESEHA
ncbi:MAG: RrF2 family transcriptional regulator [Phycisphaerae bacterium]